MTAICQTKLTIQRINHMTQTAVHVRCNTSGKVQRVQREGRQTLIMPSYAAKADTILNEVLYPKDELEASYLGLNRTPAPLGHPEINGKFVPALDPEALARNHVFAWNENPRWDGERIALDVVIDEGRANQSEDGRKVLAAINAETPIATSTGLLCNMEAAEGQAYKATARNIEWDHVAILLGEEPAISPDQGVGIFVNAAGSGEIEVINSTLEENAEDEVAWAAQHLAQALDKRDRVPAIERMMAGIMKAVLPGRDTPAINGKDADMTDKAQFDALNAKVEDLAKAQAAMPETIANTITEALKPVVDAQAEIAANAKAKDEAEHAAMVNKVVEAKIDGLTEDVAKKMDGVALNALLTMHAAQNKKAAPLSGGILNSTTETESMSPLAGVK